MDTNARPVAGVYEMLYTRSGIGDVDASDSSSDLMSAVSTHERERTHGFHTLTLLSHEPVTSRFCSGIHAIALTAFSCAPSTRASPVERFHLVSASTRGFIADALAHATVQAAGVEGIPRAPERDREDGGGVLQPVVSYGTRWEATS
jgi:hypothetical protein